MTGEPLSIGDGVAITLVWLAAGCGRSKPVAMTVNANLPLHRRLVHGAEDDFRVLAHRVVDILVDLMDFTEVRSAPPVMLTRTPVAPDTDTLSRSGLAIACWAASMAAILTAADPVPISAEPPSCMTVRTSAKSTFTSQSR